MTIFRPTLSFFHTKPRDGLGNIPEMMCFVSSAA